MKAFVTSSFWITVAALSLGLAAISPSSVDAQSRVAPFPQPAQNQTLEAEARSIIVNPVVTDFRLDLGVNKPGNNPVYRIGEPITLALMPNRDAYIYLFSIEASGRVNLILPNRFAGGQHFVRAGERRTFPTPDANYRFSIAGPRGQAQVFAVASKQPLNLDSIAQFQGNESFARTQVDRSGLGNAISRAIVVEEVPPPDWVTSTLLYQVR
ncbi:MAG: DUF4384 domain-containing protein [Synechococcaceae cyanobacterium SM2_3_2]|nr:DUF4384 domain-containing protein [Synechococcaceae cyanobacterium SM2_3_2]